jgi:hypothetical protein
VAKINERYWLPTILIDPKLSLLPKLSNSDGRGAIFVTILTSNVTLDHSIYDNINKNLDPIYVPLAVIPNHENHFDQHGE